MSEDSQVVSIILKLFQLFLKNSHKFLFLGATLVLVKLLITEFWRVFIDLFDISPGSSFLSQLSLVELLVFMCVGIIIFYSINFIIAVYFQILKRIITKENQNLKNILIDSIKKTGVLGYTIVFQLLLLIMLFSLLVIPGIVFFIFWLFTIPVVLFENKKGLTALKESAKKISGEFFTLLLIVLFLTLFFIIFHNVISSFIPYLLERFISNSAIEVIIEFLGDSLLFSSYLLIPLLLIIGNLTLTQTKTPPVDSKEEIAKSYILEYRDNYSKQAIVNVLAKELVTQTEAENLVEKYY